MRTNKFQNNSLAWHIVAIILLSLAAYIAARVEIALIHAG